MNSPVTPQPATFPRSLAVQQLLLSFSANLLSQPTPDDGFLTARFVGEFSAGKTRLLRELLDQQIPQALFPISSLERQTRLPLEITYGDTAALTLIEREHDYSTAVHLESFTRFPERNELTHLDPMKHRLRLTLAEPQMILPDGDGYSDDKSPKRLFLIDTPGWNSGDDDIAEQDAGSLMVGAHNLAVVYVCQAGRLDGATNERHLADFMSVLADADADFLGKPRLLIVVTACPKTQAAHLGQRMKDLASRLWRELDRDPDDLDLEVFCIDFQNLPASDLQRFRDDFWRSLLAPLGHASQPASSDPCATALRRWPADWHLTAQLLDSYHLLERARQLLDKARAGDEFVAGMNMYRLIGLSEEQLREKVLRTWLRQLASDVAPLKDWTVPALAEGHPLAQWWEQYWQVEMQRMLAPVRKFFATALSAIEQIPQDLEDLQLYLEQKLDNRYQAATAVFAGSFACLVKGLPALCAEPALENRIATLLSLSLLQSRYVDHYANHTQTLAAPR